MECDELLECSLMYTVWLKKWSASLFIHSVEFIIHLYNLSVFEYLVHGALRVVLPAAMCKFVM